MRSRPQQTDDSVEVPFDTKVYKVRNHNKSSSNHLMSGRTRAVSNLAVSRDCGLRQLLHTRYVDIITPHKASRRHRWGARHRRPVPDSSRPCNLTAQSCGATRRVLVHIVCQVPTQRWSIEDAPEAGGIYFSTAELRGSFLPAEDPQVPAPYSPSLH